MTHERIEQQLRSEPMRDESRYVGRPLPATIAEARFVAGVQRRSLTPSLLLAVASGAAAIVVALVFAVPWLNGGPLDELAGSGPSGAATPSPSASSAVPDATETALAPCRARDFAVTSDPWDAGAGSRGTTVVFRAADSVGACLLGGSLQARLTDADDEVLLEAASEPTPSLRVEGGTQLEIGVHWSNWCGPAPAEPLALTVTFPGDDFAMPLVPPAGTDILVPPCMGSGEGSSLSLTQFQPSQRLPPQG